MEKYSLSVVIFCATFMPMVLGFPYGDISIACDSMLPDHGSAPQTSPPPYVISVSFDRYSPGNEIQVILEGTSPSGFKGFMVQAREIHGNVPLGSFRVIDPNSQGLPCANISNSAISHTMPNVKHQIATTWVAPLEAKEIQLVATFVQDYDTYWVDVRSKTLSPRNSDAVNDSSTDIDTNDSKMANNSITSVISEITGDPDTANENHEDIDVSTLFTDSEAENESETLADAETTPNLKRRNDTERSRRKSVVSVKVKCVEGTSQIVGGSCIKNPQETAQSSGSKVIVVKPGGSSGCGGGGVAGVYGKYGCRDSAAGIGGQSSSLGQSVSVSSDTKVKVVSYPESKPYPPERDSYTSKIKYTGVIQSQGGQISSGSSSVYGQGGRIPSGSSSVYGQGGRISSGSSSVYGLGGSRPQGGSGPDIRITIQDGSGSPACNKNSPSYNIKICNQQGQSSGSQSGSSFSGSQQGGSYSSGSSSYSSGRNPCGQGTGYDRNPCRQGQSSSQQSTYNNQAGSQYQGNRNPCNQGQGGSYNSNKC